MNLSLLVHTFDGYKHLWPGCFESWKNNEQYIPKYFGSDIEHYIINDRFKFIYSGPGQWSDRLIKLLEQIPTDYVLYCQEDQWPVKNPPNLSEMMRMVEEKQLFRLHLGLVNHLYRLEGEGIPLFFHPESKYLVSHQPSIWKKDFLISCLESGETPWENEYKGTLRLRNLQEIKNKIAIWPCNWYDHMCIKGKMKVTNGN